MALKVRFLFFMIVFLIFSISTYGIILKHIPAYTSKYLINISGVADVNESKLNETILEVIAVNVSVSGDQTYFQFISDESKQQWNIDNVTLMKVNDSGIYLKGEVHVNEVLDPSLNDVYSFYVNNSLSAQLNESGDLNLLKDIHVNEVLP